MYDAHRVLAVVPARGGSKGIPLKNVHPIAGRPLIAWTADVVRALAWVDRAVVSTDHLVIADAGRQAGLDVPFVRPPALSGDLVGDLEVLVHALQACEAVDGGTYDIVVMLQPTSPLRRPEHVSAAVEKLVNEGLDAVWTVSPTDSKSHPLKQLTIDRHGRLGYWDERGGQVVARQQLQPVYHRNGAAYAVTRACLLDHGTIKGERTGAIVLDEPMVSIDTLDDLRRAEAVLMARGAGGRGEPAASKPSSAVSSPPTSSTAARSAGAEATLPAPRRIVVDIDGVIAEAVLDLAYDRAGPIPANVARVNALYDAGCHVVLFTARGTMSGRDWTAETRRQLEQWGVRYHELRFGKPAADYYVDDRMISLVQALALCGVSDPAGQVSDPT